ncbi:MAG: hypothetical protein EON88_13050 [Brevundimonas sp.]|nr:MAG: hypothetical protein EON88_13050 [Brevundimonas sp.]
MSAVRKITIHLPADLIDDAQAASGAGVTETVRRGLEALKRERFYAMMKDLRGKIDFSEFDLDELREDKTYGWESREA